MENTSNAKHFFNPSPNFRNIILKLNKKFVYQFGGVFSIFN